MPTKTETLLFMLLVIVLMLIEIVCGLVAYFTLGEVMSSLYILPISLNLLFVLLFFFGSTAALPSWASSH